MKARDNILSEDHFGRESLQSMFGPRPRLGSATASATATIPGGSEEIPNGVEAQKSIGAIFDQNTYFHFLCRFIPAFSVPRQKLSSFAHRHAEVPQFIWDLRGGTVSETHFGFS